MHTKKRPSKTNAETKNNSKLKKTVTKKAKKTVTKKKKSWSQDSNTQSFNREICTATTGLCVHHSPQAN